MACFVLRISPSEKVEFVISVSKKVAKKAVTRNLIRRRLRPVLRELKLSPAKYLIVAKPGAEKLKGEALKSELAMLFKKS